MTIILDQKHFLEEQNKVLNDTVDRLKKKLEQKYDTVSTSNKKKTENDHSLIFTERLRDLENEREILQARLAEKEDALRAEKEKMADTKLFTENLYEQLKASESKEKRWKKNYQSSKDIHAQVSFYDFYPNHIREFNN